MSIQLFNFKNNEVRVVVDEYNQPWWVASDVAKILGYRDAEKMTRRLDEDEKGTRSVGTLGGEQKLTVINESGLYNAILGSKKSEAREFKKWVTGEVLPTIRKHGAYMTKNKIREALSNPEMLGELILLLKDEQEKREQLEAQAALDKPKVIFAEAVAASDTDILVGDLAKILKGNGINIGAVRLFEWMRNNGFLISRKGADWNMPTQKAMELGLFRIKETAITHGDGHVTINKTPKVTGKGQQYFIERFLNGKFTIENGVNNNAQSA